MAYSLTIDWDLSLITVTYDESSGFEDRKAALGELVRHLDQHPETNILVDASAARHALTEQEQLEFARMLGEKQLYFRCNRTAIYNPRSLHTQLLAMSYLEGHTRFVEFDNMADARAWATGEID